MQFNSLEFAVLLLLVLGLTAVIRSNTWRKTLLLAASCYFYAYWDYRFLGLLLAGSLIDYGLAKLSRNNSAAMRKMALYTSLAMNLSLLALFKYYDFFLSSLATLITGLGLHAETMNLLLPLGISFYTFMRISYSIDVYRGTIRAEESLLNFTLYTCFFPHVVSGPLTRPAQLLSQFKKRPAMTAMALETGLRLFCFGLFKKVVLADRLGLYVDAVYGNGPAYDALSIWCASAAYTLQIYLDFSGYTDMARGTAQCLGYTLANNFNYPYLARNPSDFWRRWHMSLSLWFRDYVYIPLGGNRLGPTRTYCNLLATMLLCGLWHGAGWTFIFWGGWHGAGLVVHRLFSKDANRTPSPIGNRCAIAACLMFTHIGWVFFRARDFEQASTLLKHMFLGGGSLTWVHPFVPACLLATLVIHWAKARMGETWEPAPAGSRFSPLVTLSAMGLALVFATTGFSPFIYARF